MLVNQNAEVCWYMPMTREQACELDCLRAFARHLPILTVLVFIQMHPLYQTHLLLDYFAGILCLTPQFRLTGRLYLVSAAASNGGRPLDTKASALAAQEPVQPWYTSLGEAGDRNDPDAHVKNEGYGSCNEPKSGSTENRPAFSSVELDSAQLSNVYPPNQFHGRSFDWELERVGSWKNMSPQVSTEDSVMQLLFLFGAPWVQCL